MAGTRTRRAALAALPLAVCLAFSAGVSAQTAAPGELALSPAEAGVELEQAIEALTEPSALDPTDELRDLALALPHLDGRERRRAKAILARPPAGEEGAGDIGATWSESATATRQYFDSPGGRFRVHYVATGSDAPDLTDAEGEVGVPDYVEQVAAYADTSADVQNGDLGWPAAKPDGSKGDAEVIPPTPTTGRTDIYLSDICCPGGSVLFGYAASDDATTTCTRAPFRCFAYLVLDNDYAEPEYDYGGVPDVPLQVTTAHEYNHILQFRLDALQDTWMFESTAVWAEEKTFPDADDWIVTFLGSWAARPSRPIAKATPRIYGSAVWNHWLELGAGFGAGVVLDAWERSRKTRPKDYAVGSYSRAIKVNGGRGFPQEFARFAAATAEWRVLDGNFPGPDANAPDEGQFPDVRRQGRLRPGGGARRFQLDHTAFRLIRVDPGGRSVVRLRVRLPRGVRSGAALVARDGGPLSGSVTTKRSFRKRGGRVSLRLSNARSYERITAVVVNADGRVRGFGGLDWIYAKDDERYRARLR